jgi:hypothetical protein
MKTRALTTALLVVLLVPPAATATQLSNRGESMVDAMIGAMDAMGLVEKGKKLRDSKGGGWSPESLAGNSFQMPGSSPFGGWSNPMNPMSPMSPASPMSPWSSTPWSGGSMPWGSGGMPWSGGSMPWGGGGMPWGGSVPGAGGSPWSAMQWPGGAASLPRGMPMPGWPPMPGDRETQGGRESTDFLDGQWEGESGELLMIRRGMFRIYADAETWRDGYLSLRGDRLTLRDAESGGSREYDMRYEDDLLALRSPDGQVIGFRRLSGESGGY